MINAKFIVFEELSTIDFDQELAHNLSMRQQQCLSLMLAGNTAKTSAKILGLSYRTVENYIERIKEAFDVQFKSELILKALKAGFKPYI